ncbi:hypothetical protein [Fictibacillus terranigra]|uniref:Pre-peptidase C-terminal domain-containing protein n=1 Tax=Fictibacillus terranigra TaxID=3058424 RepID=A0ABT8ECF4_9BACL|nr:hypothetical protein [Fictibacillus sp. CENA-BCM004]MDN4075580.1 hypothetical protein [Fictibacillus sp. CENA-BCM004]
MKAKTILLTVFLLMVTSTVYAASSLQVRSNGGDKSSSSVSFDDTYATISIKKTTGSGKLKLELWQKHLFFKDERVGQTPWITEKGVGYQKVINLAESGDYYLKVVDSGNAGGNGIGVNYKATSFLQ